MSNSILAVKNISLGVETEFGTPVSPSAYGEIKSENIKHDKEITPVDITTGNRYGPRQAVELKDTVDGPLKGLLYPSFFGFWAKGLLGSVSSELADGETIVYKHTFSQAATLPHFTLQVDRGNSEVKKITSAIVDTMKLEASDKFVDMDISVKAAEESTGADYTASQASEKPMVFHNVKIGFGADIAAARAAVAATDTPVLNWGFDADNKLEVSHVSGQKLTYRIDPKKFEEKLNFTTFFDNATQRDAYRNFTKKAAVISMIGAAIGEASYYQLDIELPNINYTAHEVEYNAGELLKEKCELIGLYDDDATHAIQMILYNLKANYNS
jgi:hypothetical protein